MRITFRHDTTWRVDTVTRLDTVWREGSRIIVRVDTHVRHDTLRIPGIVPVTVPVPPPGQQARAAPCDGLGPVPPGAFILVRGDAWDFDYDWLAESARRSVPPAIVSVSRGRRP